MGRGRVEEQLEVVGGIDGDGAVGNLGDIVAPGKEATLAGMSHVITNSCGMDLELTQTAGSPRGPRRELRPCWLATGFARTLRGLELETEYH